MLVHVSSSQSEGGQGRVHAQPVADFPPQVCHIQLPKVKGQAQAQAVSVPGRRSEWGTEWGLSGGS